MGHIFAPLFNFLRKQPAPVQWLRFILLPAPHHQVRDAERGNILKEMRALGGLGPHSPILKFNNGTDPGDISPLDRDTKPGVSRTPATGTDQQVWSFFPVQDPVHLTNFHSNVTGKCVIKPVRLYKNNILHLFIYTMTQCLC